MGVKTKNLDFLVGRSHKDASSITEFTGIGKHNNWVILFFSFIFFFLFVRSFLVWGLTHFGPGTSFSGQLEVLWAAFGFCLFSSTKNTLPCRAFFNSSDMVGLCRVLFF